MKSKQNPPTGYGSVRSDEILTLSECKKRLGWGHKSVATAKRVGLRVVPLGRQKYVLGSDVLEFFRKLAEENDTRT